MGEISGGKYGEPPGLDAKFYPLLQMQQVEGYNPVILVGQFRRHHPGNARVRCGVAVHRMVIIDPVVITVLLEPAQKATFPKRKQRPAGRPLIIN